MPTHMEHEILAQGKLLTACLKNNAAAVAQAARELSGKHPIYLLARGSSENACIYFKYLCETLTDIPASFVYPSVHTLYAGTPDMTGGALIAVSQGGRGEDINEIVSAANKAGVYTLSITNDKESRLAKATSRHIFMDVGLERSMAATKTFTAEMLVLGMLAHALAGKKPCAYADIGALADKVLAKREEIAELARRLEHKRELYVLSRGYALCVAREACCKLQETCFLNANAYSTADFMHGPFALIAEGTPVLVLAPSDQTLASSREMLSRLHRNGADILLVTDDAALADEYGGALLPSAGNILFPFSAAFLCQMLALELSALRGINPDESRNLNKYTVTK